MGEPTTPVSPATKARPSPKSGGPQVPQDGAPRAKSSGPHEPGDPGYRPAREHDADFGA